MRCGIDEGTLGANVVGFVRYLKDRLTGGSCRDGENMKEIGWEVGKILMDL